MKKLVLFAGLAAMGVVTAVAQTPTISFNARGMVAISDADMAASALIDGKLLRDNTIKDKLTSIKFPLVRGGSTVGETVVPNSTLTYTKSMAVPKTGGLAFVLDTRSAPAETVTEYTNVMKEFPDGQRLYVVDVVNLANPKVKFQFPVGKNPTSIDVYKNELMISTSVAGKELVFYEVDDSGKPTRALYLPSTLDSTNRIIDLSWHPTGNFLAVTLESTKELALYKIIREAGKLRNIEMVGKPFKVGQNPTSGKFSEDGKFYYVMDNKGDMGKASGNGELHVVEFSMDGSAEHKVNSSTAVGLNPGAFSISPDGNMVVVVNSGKSAMPWTQEGAGTSSSLTLFKLASGALTKVADYPFQGIMPQSVAFDKDGSNLAVAVYEYLDYGDRTGGIEFWSVAKGDTPSLNKQLGRISVERGAHTIRVIP
jgi:6-phosphogluconolactonase (cycloisomerase 2 family)